MIGHQTRDNALMSSSSSHQEEDKSGWNRCSPVGAMPHRFSLAIPSDIAVFRAEIVINTARSFLLVYHRQNIGWS